MNTYKYKEIETGNNVKEEKNEKGRRDTIEDNERHGHFFFLHVLQLRPCHCCVIFSILQIVKYIY